MGRPLPLHPFNALANVCKNRLGFFDLQYDVACLNQSINVRLDGIQVKVKRDLHCHVVEWTGLPHLGYLDGRFPPVVWLLKLKY